MRTISALVITFLYSTMAIGQTEVPNTFQSGQPARAAEVNDNFTTLESAVNDNSTDIASNTTAIISNDGAIQANSQTIAAVATIAIPRVKANGQDIGTLFSSLWSDEEPLSIFLWVVSDAGYLFSIYMPGSGIATPGAIRPRIVEFSTTNCTGQAYLPSSNDQLKWLLGSGVVFAFFGNDPLDVYYSPSGSVSMSGIVTQSRLIDSGCEQPISSSTDLIAVFPNDPLVTGVPIQRQFDTPITLGVQIIQVSPP